MHQNGLQDPQNARNVPDWKNSFSSRLNPFHVIQHISTFCPFLCHVHQGTAAVGAFRTFCEPGAASSCILPGVRTPTQSCATPDNAGSNKIRHKQCSARFIFGKHASPFPLCSFSPAQLLQTERQAPYATMRTSSGRAKRFLRKEETHGDKRNGGTNLSFRD